jgi:hypothetical protein
MSAHLKFIPVDEVELGHLSDDLMPRWKEILELRRKIDELEEAYDNTLKLFFADTIKTLPVKPDHSREEPQLKIDEKGQVYQSFCPCPLCQSKSQSLPLGIVLQAMQTDGPFDPEVLEEIREAATEERIVEEVARRKRLMLN